MYPGSISDEIGLRRRSVLEVSQLPNAVWDRVDEEPKNTDVASGARQNNAGYVRPRIGGWLTKQAAKDAAHHVIVPSSVALAALGIISLAVKAWSDTGNTSSINSAFVERDRQYREDRKEIMGILMEMQGDIRRIQGKLEGNK